MLRHIPRNITPELMETLMRMGHGDEIVFGDANFPADTMGRRVIHLDGYSIPDILASILPFFPLDTFVRDNVFLMEVVDGEGSEPPVWQRYEALIREHDAEKAFAGFAKLERFAFYERAKQAFAVVATGESARCSNLILKMGVVDTD